MLKHLKLYKALYLIGIGVFIFAMAMLLKTHERAFKYLLGFSGALFMLGSVLFLYPILFAKKIDNEGKEVELQSVDINNPTKDKG